jgi:son of sevenless-like protein
MAAAEAGVLYASDDDEGVNSFFVRALYDFSSEDASSLSFERGALIEVLTQLESGWWDGLLGNDVRGWFPSNYVEVISDEEAEAELRARGIEFDEADEEEEEQNDAAASDGASQRSGKAVLSGFDLGPDYESVRQLMEDDGASGNAFEQLAEAAAFGAASGSSHSAAGGPDRARAGSSASAVPATTSPARSTPRAGPSERERLRSHSTAATASIVPQSRPRAATNVASSATASLQAPQGRERALSAAAQGSRARSRSRKDEADFWVPKVTDRGEVSVRQGPVQRVVADVRPDHVLQHAHGRSVARPAGRARVGRQPQRQQHAHVRRRRDALRPLEREPPRGAAGSGCPLAAGRSGVRQRLQSAHVDCVHRL